ncbi:DUF1289 domain-containing protein [Litoribacillus peritrichatus]|uniref:DUF1289 domain-containing protein n=1 Tax=Litoribacillus peritrichatus TaxID=718191 RepID=A0ABP7M0T1_9GAMM
MSQTVKNVVTSPCVSICYLDEQDICQGCFRSGEEISHWGDYSNEQRMKVMEKVREREKSSFNFIG